MLSFSSCSKRWKTRYAGNLYLFLRKLPKLFQKKNPEQSSGAGKHLNVSLLGSSTKIFRQLLEFVSQYVSACKCSVSPRDEGVRVRIVRTIANANWSQSGRVAVVTAS